jgi:hypothetical protein
MTRIQAHFNYLETQFAAIQQNLICLTFDNFSEVITLIKMSIDNIIKTRKEFSGIDSDHQFAELNKDFTERAKQIKLTFDNVIANRKTELDSVMNQLNALQNQKKLTTYKR